MVHLDWMHGMIAAYVASPKGQETMRNFLSSPEGKRAIDAYLATPEGQRIACLLLGRALDSLDLPAEVKAEIRRSLDAKRE